ncbi:MAG: hypothetical protein ACFFCV_08395, partial [Promethearchaeota archaeon]
MAKKGIHVKVFLVIIISIIFSLYSNRIFKNYYDKTLDNYQYSDNSKIFDKDLNLQGIVKDYYTTEYLNNSNFNSQNSWFTVEEGDTSDVRGNVTSGQANFEILGKEHTFSLIADPPLAVNWTEMDNPSIPDRPDIDEITSRGCRVSHEFDDITAVQQPSVHWDQNISIPTDMSDYVIKSASIQSIINATVDENLD